MTERDIFLSLLSLPDQAAKIAYLDEVCAGRPELRAGVEALLTAQVAPGILDEPAVSPLVELPSAPGSADTFDASEHPSRPDDGPNRPAVTTTASPHENSVSVISERYALVERIGEGGMGEVWIAWQILPVKRKVAIKLIKKGMDSRAVLQRFEQERQALAIMDHPNIAKVLDAGLTAAGRPFFVMEFVDGLPLKKFCDEKMLTPKECLELFVPICQAVQHAHQKGIVHRDLKPANILVTMIDGKPIPRVIDFGVAKATAGKVTDESLSTQFGSIVGTLEYMSPEQAGFTGVDIDTRTDIYSLGVILYELLTGLRPLDVKRLREAAFTEMIRIIREEEPSKPSTRLSSHESLPSMAALRQTEPRRLMAMLRGELDWVVMKCLEKNRERRYETANGLARDIQRYLADEPVEARPPSPGYRLGKLLRRHKGTALALTAIVLLLIGGILSTSWQAAQARQARDLARANERRAVDAASAAHQARQAEVEQRTKAEAAERRASAEAATSKAVSDFFQSDVLLQADVSHQVRQGDRAKGGLTIREALDRAAARIGDRFAGEKPAEAAIRQAIARAYVSLGESKLALPHQERAYELFKSSIGDDDTRTLEAKSFLADCHAVAGDVSKVLGMRRDVAERLANVVGPSDPRSITAHQSVAIQLLSAGRLSEAIKIYENLLPAIEQAPSNKEDLRISTRAGLAAGYSRAGRFREALPLLQEVHQWFTANRPADDPDVFHALNSLAFCYYNMGRLEDAQPLQERCLKQRSEKYGRTHPDTIQSLNNLALLYLQLGRKSEASALQEEAWRYKKAQSGPSSPQFLSLQTNLAQIYMESGKLSRAIELFEETYRLFKTTLGPGDVSTTRAGLGLGSAYTRAGRYDEGVAVLQEALAPWRAGKGDVPFAVIQARNNLATAFIESGSPTRALTLLEDELPRASSTLGDDNPITVRMAVTLGAARREAGQVDRAIQLLEHTRTLRGPRERCDLLGELAAAYERVGDLNSALATRRAALADALKTHGSDESRKAAARAGLGSTLVQARQSAEAEPLLLDALKIRRELEPDAWTTFFTASTLGAALLDQKKFAAAEPLIISGYEGLKALESKIPAPGKPRLTEAGVRAIKLYEDWGKKDKAAEWRAKLARPSAKPLPQP